MKFEQQSVQPKPYTGNFLVLTESEYKILNGIYNELCLVSMGYAPMHNLEQVSLDGINLKVKVEK